MNIKLFFGKSSFKLFFLTISSLLLIGLVPFNLLSQNQNAGIGTTNPHPSSVFELSNDLLTSPKGFLLPRMTQSNRNLISSPATSLLIYQTDNTPGFYYYDGSNWIRLISGSINLATEVTGILPIANGGTNTNATPTAGAIAYGTGSAYAFSSVGTNGYLLTSGGSGAPSWTDPSTLGIGNSWILSGNSGTNPSTNYLGTSDATDFVIRTNSTERIRFTSGGNINLPGFTANRFLKTDGSSNIVTSNLSLTDFPDLSYGKLWIGDNTNRPVELTVNNAQIIVGNSSNQASAVNMSGDGVLSNTGILTVVGLRGRSISSAAPSDGYVLKWNNTASQWEPAVDAGGTGGWMLSGNAISSGDFLGTTNSQDLIIRTNNTERIRITSDGRVGINNNNPGLGSSIALDIKGLATSQPTLLIQVANSSQTTPVMRLSGVNSDLAQNFLINSTNVTAGVQYTDGSSYYIYKIRSAATFSGSSGYSDANLLMQIHTDGSSKGIVGFPHQSRARAYRNANQTINNNTWTKIQFNTENYDEQSEFDNSTNYRFTAKEKGFYQVNARAEFDFSSLGIPGNQNSYILIAIRVNNNVSSFGNKLGLNNNDGNFNAIRNNNAPIVTDILELGAGDYIEIFIFQNTGGNYSIIGGSANTYVAIHKLS